MNTEICFPLLVWPVVFIVHATTLYMLLCDYRGSIILEGFKSYNYNKVEIDASRSIIVYHEVPKTGSTTVSDILEHFCESRNYTARKFAIHSREITESLRMELAKELSELEPLPAVLFVKLYFYIDFPRSSMKNPFFFGFIRDPVDHFVSLFNYIRFTATSWRKSLYQKIFRYHGWKTFKSWKHQSLEKCILDYKYDCRLDTWQSKLYLTIPYFCGEQANNAMIVRAILTFQVKILNASTTNQRGL